MRHEQSRTSATLERELAVATQEIARLRAASFVPGKMYCVKCVFTLERRTFYVLSGTMVATPGNEPEACPNGCGPLWPVTREQEARDCWAHIEDLANQLYPEKHL